MQSSAWQLRTVVIGVTKKTKFKPYPGFRVAYNLCRHHHHHHNQIAENTYIHMYTTWKFSMFPHPFFPKF